MSGNPTLVHLWMRNASLVDQLTWPIVTGGVHGI